MADTGSLGVRAELDKVLASEHADLLREGICLMRSFPALGRFRHRRVAERVALHSVKLRLDLVFESLGESRTHPPLAQNRP